MSKILWPSLWAMGWVSSQENPKQKTFDPPGGASARPQDRSQGAQQLLGLERSQLVGVGF